jgi:futalosine hydrolase
MKILLVSATITEIEGFYETLENRKCLENNFFRGFMGNRMIDILVSGVGSAATMEHISSLLFNCRYDLIINTGICGSFRKEFIPGTVVNIISEIWGDLGAEDQESFLDLFDLGMIKTGEKPYSGIRILNGGNIYSSLFAHFPQVNGITVNRTHGNLNSIEKCIRKYNPDVESMEGAAVFSYCNSRNINFQCLRSISNFVEPRNRSDWNIESALSNLTKELKIVLSVI